MNLSACLALFISEAIKLGIIITFMNHTGNVALNQMNLNVCPVLFIFKAILMGIIITCIIHTQKMRILIECI